jgi:hypothetical protein
MLSERSRQPTIFKRDEQQVGETWTASIMETEQGVTRQQEADILAAWLKTQTSLGTLRYFIYCLFIF